MKFINKYTLIWMIIIAIFFSPLSINATSYEEYNTTDIESLAFKQELPIPIDTSLEIAKFQPIDIRVEFSNPCWAKDEKDHSVRIGFDEGSKVKDWQKTLEQRNITVVRDVYRDEARMVLLDYARAGGTIYNG